MPKKKTPPQRPPKRDARLQQAETNLERALADREAAGKACEAARQAWEDAVRHTPGKKPQRERRAALEKAAEWKRVNAHVQAARTRLEELPQRLAEEWAVARVVGWEQRDLQPEDYDFRSWACGGDAVPGQADDGHIRLRLGALYEYAREGRKLRGLLLLVQRARARDKSKPRRHTRNEGALEPVDLSAPLDPWDDVGAPAFEGLTESEAVAALGEMFHGLAILAEPLAANLSFAEVWRAQRTPADQAIEAARVWRQLRVRHGLGSHHLHARGAAVELAGRDDLAGATTLHTHLTAGQPGTGDPPRVIADGKEVLAVRVDWANFRDEHLAARFGELVRDLRRARSHGASVPPEPKPQRGTGKVTDITAALDALTALRLLHHLEVGEAIKRFQDCGLNRFAEAADESNFYGKGKAAEANFSEVFDGAETPYHADTWRQRQRQG